MTTRLELPAQGADVVSLDGKEIRATRHGEWLHVDGDWTGSHSVEVK